MLASRAEPKHYEPERDRSGRCAALAACVVVVCAYFSYQAAGWLITLYFLPYVLICAFHIYLHFRAGEMLSRTRGLVIASNVLLLLAFLLQWDIGDGDRGWLTINVMIKGTVGLEAAAPSWWPAGMIMNGLLFLPELACLIVIWRRVRQGDIKLDLQSPDKSEQEPVKR